MCPCEATNFVSPIHPVATHLVPIIIPLERLSGFDETAHRMSYFPMFDILLWILPHGIIIFIFISARPAYRALLSIPPCAPQNTPRLRSIPLWSKVISKYSNPYRTLPYERIPEPSALLVSVILRRLGWNHRHPRERPIVCYVYTVVLCKKSCVSLQRL